MKRITIIIDEAVWDKLPQKGKSPFINLVLKNHFRKDSIEEFYQYIKQKMLREGLISDGGVTFESIATGMYTPPKDEELQSYIDGYKNEGFEFKREGNTILFRKPPLREWHDASKLEY